MSVLTKELEEAIAYHGKYHRLWDEGMDQLRSIAEVACRFAPEKARTTYVIHPDDPDNEGLGIVLEDWPSPNDKVEVIIYQQGNVSVEVPRVDKTLGKFLQDVSFVLSPKPDPESEGSGSTSIDDKDDDAPLTKKDLKEFFKEFVASQ